MMWISSLFKDALRYWFSRPLLALVGIVLLALGTGVLNLIWSVTDTIVLKPLPYPESDRLYGIESVEVKTRKHIQTVAIGDFKDIKDNQKSFEAMVGYRGDFLNYRHEDGSTEQVFGARVTPGFNEVFAPTPLLGNLFSPEHFNPGKSNVALIGYDLWERLFGRDPDVIGKKLRFDKELYEVIGVLPKSFKEPAISELWLPFPNGSGEYFVRDSRYWSGVGRLKEGVSVSEARGELQTLAQQFERYYPATNKGWSLDMKSFQEMQVGDVKTPLYLLLAAVGLVLLTTCVNLANLQMMSGLQRSGEMGIRLAIGESAQRLFSRVFLESFIICFIGGALGFGLCVLGLSLSGHFLPPMFLPRVHELSLSISSVWISIAGILVTSVIFGLLPAYLAFRTPPGIVMRANHTRSGQSGGAKRTRSFLLLVQVAVTLLIVHAAVFTYLGMRKLKDLPLGFEVENKSALLISPSNDMAFNLPRLSRLYQDIQTGLDRLDGVRSVTTVSSPPLLQMSLEFGVEMKGRDLVSERGVPATADYNSVSRNYLDTLGLEMVKGEFFSERNDHSTYPVAVVNEAFVKAYLQDIDPINQEVKIMPWMEPRFRRIIGVVQDYKQTSLTEAARPMVMVPMEQTPWMFTAVVLETDPGSPGVMALVESSMRGINPDMGVTPISFEEALESLWGRAEMMSVLLTWFAWFVGVLSLFGIGTQVAFITQERMPEWGIRLALGSQSGQLKQLLVQQMVKLALLGSVLGTVVLYFVYRTLRAESTQIPEWDVWVSIGFYAAIAILTAFITWGLSWRVARAHPTDLLKSY